MSANRQLIGPPASSQVVLPGVCGGRGDWGDAQVKARRAAGDRYQPCRAQGAALHVPLGVYPQSLSNQNGPKGVCRACAVLRDSGNYERKEHLFFWGVCGGAQVRRVVELCKKLPDGHFVAVLGSQLEQVAERPPPLPSPSPRPISPPRLPPPAPIGPRSSIDSLHPRAGPAAPSPLHRGEHHVRSQTLVKHCQTNPAAWREHLSQSPIQSHRVLSQPGGVVGQVSTHLANPPRQPRREMQRLCSMCDRMARITSGLFAASSRPTLPGCGTPPLYRLAPPPPPPPLPPASPHPIVIVPPARRRVN